MKKNQYELYIRSLHITCLNCKYNILEKKEGEDEDEDDVEKKGEESKMNASQILSAKMSSFR